MIVVAQPTPTGKGPPAVKELPLEVVPLPPAQLEAIEALVRRLKDGAPAASVFPGLKEFQGVGEWRHLGTLAGRLGGAPTPSGSVMSTLAPLNLSLPLLFPSALGAGTRFAALPPGPVAPTVPAATAKSTLERASHALNIGELGLAGSHGMGYEFPRSSQLDAALGIAGSIVAVGLIGDELVHHRLTRWKRFAFFLKHAAAICKSLITHSPVPVPEKVKRVAEVCFVVLKIADEAHAVAVRPIKSSEG